MRLNDHFLKLKAGYLFPEIARRVEAFAAEHPGAPIIKLGIGDVTEPLPAACLEAMHRAVDDQGRRESFHGYGPSQGYPWLREKIVEHDFSARGCDVHPEEVFVSDASKCDVANITDLFGPGNTIAVADPVYPVYVDTNVMAGQTGGANTRGEYEGLVYLPAAEANGFLPELPERRVDIIYLCYPNNPTGAVADRDTLARWVAYAHEHGSLILFDAAYEAFVTDPGIPRSIYEIDGALGVAVEFRSFSKNAGFTGTRCAYHVVPRSVTGRSASGESVPLHTLWARRQSTKFNGVSYIIQRGAEAVYSPRGREQTAQLVRFYLDNAAILRDALEKMGLRAFGGVHSPYVWLKTPDGVSSWAFFDKLLAEAHLVGTPGSGFGASGEGYFRLSAFNSRANIDEAVRRLGERLAVGS